MHGYIYRIMNKNNSKMYIGLRRWNNFETIKDDKYMGSGKALNNAYKKYGIENFEKEILDIAFNEEELFFLEEVYGEFAHSDPNYYNLIPCGKKSPIMYGDLNPSKRMEVRMKISKSNLGKKKQTYYSEERLKQISEQFSRPHTKEQIQKRILTRIKKYGRYHSPKQIESIKRSSWFKTEIGQQFLTGENNPSKNKQRIWKPRTEKTKSKISESLKGMPHWWQDKINKNPEKIAKTAEKHKGMTRSVESKLKMSLAKKGKSPSNKGKKYYLDAETNEGGYFIPGEQPNGWENKTRTINKH